jgi:prolyl oligopeptidase
MDRYPPTPRVDVTDVYHGTTVADPYRWLEDLDDPDVRAWIAAQNEVTERWLAEAPEREALRRRLAELWNHPRASAPARRGAAWFQLRNTGLQDQDVLYVMDAPDTEGRVLLDPNALSEDGTIALVGGAADPEAKHHAYALAEAGSDWMTWRVRVIATGEDTGDEVRWSKFAPAAWLPDGSGFVYGAYDPPSEGEVHEQANRNHRLLLHRLGAEQADDELVYERPDQPEWLFAPEVTEDGRYLVVHIAHGTDPRNRVFVRDLHADGGATSAFMVELLAEGDAAYAYVGNDGPRFFFVTDAEADRGRLIAIDMRDPRPEAWEELVAEHEVDTLERVVLAGGRRTSEGLDLSDARFVIVYLHHARHRLARFGLDGAPDGEVALPDLGSVEQIAARPDDAEVHFTFTSFTSPPAVYRHVIATGETSLVRPPGLDVDRDAYVTEQVFVAHDGVQAPMFLVRRADLTPTGDVPALLWGYGGFQIPVTPMFRVWWLAWLERGGLLAVPNLRGGGEYGTAWHDDGRLANKQHTFDDAIACAEWLVEEGWTRPERLAINGASNGGLLVGACMTQRPDLFGAAVPEVGVLDLLRFDQFTIGWAWRSDYGDPADPEAFGWLAAYSPLHNLRPGVSYPATLVVTGDHDDRVVPAHSYKFAAALQALGGPNPALLRVETRAGHGMGKPTRVLVEERADVLAFLLRALGATSREPRNR